MFPPVATLSASQQRTVAPSLFRLKVPNTDHLVALLNHLSNCLFATETLSPLSFLSSAV